MTVLNEVVRMTKTRSYSVLEYQALELGMGGGV